MISSSYVKSKIEIIHKQYDSKMVQNFINPIKSLTCFDKLIFRLLAMRVAFIYNSI